MPDVLVSDANIFIDFRVGGILGELFELSEDIVVPDALYRPQQSSVLGTVCQYPFGLAVRLQRKDSGQVPG